MYSTEFDNVQDVERDLANGAGMSQHEHVRREIKARRALRRWEDRQARLMKAARYLASTGRHELAMSIMSAIELREF